MTKGLRPYVAVCDAVATLLRPHAEVVLHDLATGKIAYIANSYSKRKAGDTSLNEPEPAITDTVDVIGPYAKSRWDGRRLKSVTAVLRDERRKAIGLLCINYDVDSFAGVLQQLRALIDIPSAEEVPAALMSKDWREAVNTSVSRFLASRDVTLAGLTSQDVSDLLDELRHEGVFEIRNAVPYVAEVLRLSRATIYNRLREARPDKAAS
jgi:D-arginine utilization repressor